MIFIYCPILLSLLNSWIFHLDFLKCYWKNIDRSFPSPYTVYLKLNFFICSIIKRNNNSNGKRKNNKKDDVKNNSNDDESTNNSVRFIEFFLLKTETHTFNR